MDFRLSPEAEAFRDDVRGFLKENWEARDFDAHSINVRSYDFANAESRQHDHELIKKLVDNGWYTMHWPEEYGGQNASFDKQFVYMEELGYAGAPEGIAGRQYHGRPHDPRVRLAQRTVPGPHGPRRNRLGAGL